MGYWFELIFWYQYMFGSSIQTCAFEILRNFRKGKKHMLGKHSSRFSRYRVMVNSQGVLSGKNTSVMLVAGTT